MSTPPFKNERAAWRALYGRTKAARTLHAEMKDLFKRLFPQGQRTSLRPWINRFIRFAEYTEPAPDPFGHLSQFHPDALRFIAKYGINQRAYSWKRTDLYNQKLQPTPQYCFTNARLFIEYTRDKESEMPPMVYVEGIAFGSMVMPMLHAWNSRTLTDPVAFDWTFYATAPTTRYIGVPFTIEEHQGAMDLLAAHSKQSKVILFSRENFPLLEPYLREILIERRRKARMKITTS